MNSCPRLRNFRFTAPVASRVSCRGSYRIISDSNGYVAILVKHNCFNTEIYDITRTTIVRKKKEIICRLKLIIFIFVLL